MSIEVEVAVHDGLAAVAPRGEIDITTAPELRAAIGATLDDGATAVVLDLEAVTFMDSSGLSVLVGAHRRLARRGGRLEVVGAGAAIAQTLRLTGLAGVFDVRDVTGAVIAP